MSSPSEAHQEADVVDPDPGVGHVHVAPPGRLVYLLHRSNSNVWHGAVAQSKRNTDPLQKISRRTQPEVSSHLF